jgi:Zn-finger nucleic acid-binding protein
MTPMATPGRCPRCSTSLTTIGSLRVCLSCRGVWLTEAEISGRLRERCPGDSGALEFVEGDGTALPCPACSEPMAACYLEGVPLDRCVAHGVWFDVEELERTLKAARARPIRPGAQLPVAVAVAGVAPGMASSESSGDPAATGGAVLDVLGGVLDVVGGVLGVGIEIFD